LVDLKGFRMPAEWEKQKGVWLQWPHEDFNPGYQRKLEPIWLEQTRILRENVVVHVCVQDDKRREHLEQQLMFYGIGLYNIEFHIIRTNDIWIRDNGPTFVLGENGESAAIGWKFNGWGGRYPHDLDEKVSWQIADTLGIPFFDRALVQEGGNLEPNGVGDLICTRSATLNRNRNPGLSQRAV
jgi:agmatine deiminase